LNALDPRERLIFRMAVFDGMRLGEILAIRLGDIGPKQLHIKQRVYRGTLDTPMGRKGKRTERWLRFPPER
jgi:integrase